MANNYNSKLRLLLVYDYFLKHVSPSSIEYPKLGDVTGFVGKYLRGEFDRKTYYDDFNAVNDYVALIGNKPQKDEDWIMTEGHKYFRSELLDELSYDEAHLLVDSIDSTLFVDSDISNKIINRYKMYFKEPKDQQRLYPMYKKTTRTVVDNTHNLRESITLKRIVSFNYGYMLRGAVYGDKKYSVWPLTLYFENGFYYLIAIEEKELTEALKSKKIQFSDILRRFRVDRISGHVITTNRNAITKKENRPGFETKLKTAIDKYISDSVSGFSADRKYETEIILKSNDKRSILKAATYFVDTISTESSKIFSMNLEEDTKTIMLRASLGNQPTTFSVLFSLYMFEGVTIEISSGEIKDEFMSYLNKAMEGNQN